MLRKLYYLFHRLTSKPQERGEYSSGHWQDRARRETLILCRGIEGRVLEIGCGEGLFLIQLAVQNPNLEIWGIDNDTRRLKGVERKSEDKNFKNINLLLQDATSLSFGDEYFDTVVCINVIFNLESEDIVKKVLSEMARVCKRGGRVIFDFRNSLNPFLYFKYKLAPFYDQTIKNLPLRTYRLEELGLLLGETGLSITNKIYIGSPFKRIAPIIILETEKI